MKYYKLIKEYPDSPKLDTILSHEELQYCNWNEYYEPVIEKNYEIISVISTGKCESYDKGRIIIISKSDYSEECWINKGMSIKDGSFNIYSIKRLSDNSIFTIGDKIISDLLIDDKGFIITHFSIVNELFICGNKRSAFLKDSIKFIKQPLFKTEDNVDIFEGDNCWSVDATFTKLEIKIINNNYSKEFLNIDKQFSTKEKAEEYILMNKPCLSLNDVINNISYDKTVSNFIKLNKHQFTELVKSKIK